MSKKLNFLVMMLLGILLSINQAWGADQLAYTVTFKSQSSGSDGSTTQTTTANIISAGSDYMTVESASNIYNGKPGFGIKGGGSSAKGAITLNATDPKGQVAPTKIVVNACYYGSDAKDLLVKINGTVQSYTCDLSSSLADYTITIDGSKVSKLTSITLEASVKNSARFYVTSISVYVSGGSVSPSTVTFNANGNGSCGTSFLKEASVGAGVELPSCTANPGYYFIGWATTDDATDAGSGMTASQTYKPSGDITLYAVYGYEVEWYINGSKEETAQYKKGAALALPSADPDIDCGGKVFVGWTNEANKNYSHATNAPGVLFTSASGTVTAPAKYYAVYATRSGGADKWKKVTAANVASEGAGTYAIITADGHAFNGSISSGHGQITSTAFSFDRDNLATSAPAGTCEITMTAVTGGFTMYNASNGYLYSKEASSGNLAWHATEGSYWYYNASNWSYKSNSTLLRDYQNTAFRTYSSNNGSVVQFAKKVSGSTYTDD